jgi:peptidoglycan/LPS O-acetylase OafA/YrhL
MKLLYRPEIDGLRAIAVIAVIIYHAQIKIFNHQLFKGGFIGVDIFFVISGYLITSIILNELLLTNSFSFKFFYERRIRRILPVLFVVMIASLPFGWIYLFPTSLLDFSKSILYSIGFSSNYFFYDTGQEYGALSGFFKPFLHTWSLSVEEQYYILFPFIALIIFRYIKKYLVHILIIGFITSLMLADWTSKNDNSMSFYLVHTRMWELLAGSLLAYFEIKIGRNNKYKILNLTLPFFGLVLIGYSLLFFYDGIHHPSYYTLLPIAGVSLIIWFSNKNEFITKILTTKLFVGIGLISYSLYLWHYPIFSFIKISGIASGNIINKLVLIPIIFVLSISSYFFIERPFRNKKFSFKKVLAFVFFLALILLTFNLLVIKNNGYSKRFEELKVINENYNPDNFFLSKTRMEQIKPNKKFNSEYFNILVIGDSFAEDLFNALNLNRYQYQKVDFFLGGYNYKLITNHELLKASNLVIYSYDWNDGRLESFKNNLKKIQKINPNIAITSSSNEYNVFSSLYTIIDQKIFFDKKNFDYFGLKNIYFENRSVHSQSSINQKLKKFALKEKLKYLNREDFMCNIIKKECDYVDNDGNKLFHDYGHYTKAGAKYFGNKIYENNWLKLDQE